MILETSFIIALFRNHEDAVAKAFELDERNEPIFTTSVTVFELWQGMDVKTESRREKLEQFIERFNFLNLDVKSAKIGGIIQSGLNSKGMTIDPEDCMIAGIALNHNQTILTRDEHFSRIKGLRIETY